MIEWKKANEPGEVRPVFVKEEVEMILKESESIGSIHLAVEKKIESNEEFKPNNLGFVIIGTLLIWVSYLFFLGGKVDTLFERRFEG